MTEIEPAPAQEPDIFPDKRPDDYPGYFSWRRDREASRLAAMGHPPEEVAARMQLYDREGNPDPRRAVKAIQRGLAAVYRFTADEMRLQELDNLTRIKAELYELLGEQQVVVQQGRVVYDGSGEPVKDNRFVLETYDRLLRVEEQIAKLMGLNATTRISIEADQIGSEIHAMLAVLSQAPAAPPVLLSAASEVLELPLASSE